MLKIETTVNGITTAFNKRLMRSLIVTCLLLVPLRANAASSVYILPISSGGIKTVKTQVFTSSGTYTPSTGLVYADVTVIGGGGGGDSHATGTGGGGAGGYARKVLLAATIGASQAVTVGSAGSTACWLCTGYAGTGSSFGALITTGGGSGGSGTGGAGGSASGGDINITGVSGGNGVSSGTAPYIGGVGGSSPLGSGGAAGGYGYNAMSATGYGGGGGGSGSGWGGNGSPGIVIVTEYCSQ